MISIVLPCYNEERRIGATLERVLGWLDRTGLEGELVVVDDGSSDGTADVVQAAGASDGRVRLVRHDVNCGKGHAVRSGFARSRGQWVLFSDADLATPIAEAHRLLEAGRSGADLAVASRVLSGSNIRTPQPWPRRLAGHAFRALVRLAGLTAVKDTQCGFKLLRAEAMRPVLDAVETDGFVFDVELLARAERAGLRVVEVPVAWDDVEGSKVRLYPDAFRMARELWALRSRLGRTS